MEERPAQALSKCRYYPVKGWKSSPRTKGTTMELAALTLILGLIAWAITDEDRARRLERIHVG